jgi:membrane protease YdiL (CAAX protease family)
VFDTQMADASRNTTTSDTSAGWFERHAEQPLYRVPDLGARGDTFLQVLLVLLGALVLQAVLFSLAVGLLDAVGITEDSAPVAYLSTVQAMGLLGFLVMGLVYLHWRDDPTLVGIRRPTGWDIRMILVGFITVAGVLFAAEFLFQFLGFDLADNEAIDQGRQHPELFLVFIPIQFLVTGPAEELLFRGVIQGLLRRTYGVIPGIALASALFSIAHYSALIGGGDVLPVFVILFLSGLVLGGLYEYTRTLLVPMLAHALWNTLVFGTQYAEAVDALIAG